MTAPHPTFDFRHLFRICRVPMWVTDITPLLEEFGRMRAAGVDDLVLYFQDNPREVHRLFTYIKVLDLNPAAVRFYEARDRDHLMSNLASTVDIPKLAVALVSVWLEEESFEVQATNTSLQGQKRAVRVSAPIPRRDDPDKIIPVSIVDLGPAAR